MQTLTALLKPLHISTGTPLTHLQEATLWTLRLPRAAACLVAGAGIGLAGAASQGVFRNPLADPALLGASGGGALALAIFGVFFPTVGPVAQALTAPAVAGLGAAAALLMGYWFTHLRPWRSPSSMVLCGLTVNALAMAVTGLMTYTQANTDVRRFSFWTLGGLSHASSWLPIVAAGIAMLLALLAWPRLARPLNALSLGETEARHLGFDVRRAQVLGVAVVALATGASVAVAGVIAFVGLMVPHVARRLVGCDYRHLLPASVALAAAALLASDAVGRAWAAPSEIPIGLITALWGAPFFLWLLIHEDVHG